MTASDKNKSGRPHAVASPTVPIEPSRLLETARRRDLQFLRPGTPVAVMLHEDSKVGDISADKHSACEMGIVLSGAFRVISYYSDTVLHRGGMWFVSPWQPHAGKVCEDATRYVVVTCRPSFLHQQPDVFPSPYLPFLHAGIRKVVQPRSAGERNGIVRAAERLLSEFLARQIGWQTMIRVDLIRLLIDRLRRSPIAADQGEPDHSRMAQVMALVEHVRQNLKEGMTLVEAARFMHMSRTAFAELFKQVMGSSFGQYVIRCRLQGAWQDIMFTDDKLDVVARRWGFSDSPHLCRRVKKEFSMTASQLRRSVEGRKPGSRQPSADAATRNNVANQT